MTRARNFARLYIQTTVSAAYVLAGGFGRWRNRQAMRSFTGQVGLFGVRPKLQEVAVADLVPGGWIYQVTALERDDSNLTLYELCIVNALVRMTAPRVILEIGTYDGRTTANLAHNISSGGQVYTLDLPDGPVHASGRVGARFFGSAVAERINQLWGDSLTYDFSHLHGLVDMAFVDGSHEYEAVRADSQNTVQCLRNGKGLVLWHDYGAFPGPTRALDELWLKGGKFAGLKVVAGTTLAILDLRS